MDIENELKNKQEKKKFDVKEELNKIREEKFQKEMIEKSMKQG